MSQRHHPGSAAFRVRRALRENVGAVVALGLIWLAGLLVGGYIVAHQRIHPPAWVPVVGEDSFILNAELANVQGVLPGQGQAVTVSGVQVGDIASVELVEGRALLRMRIKPRYARIYPNATLLMRPKTGLKDMIAELDPGDASAGERLADGATLSIAQTAPDVNLDEILASLDADSRDALQFLAGDGGRALGDGGGRDLADTFRQFEPLSRNVARASRLVERRHARLERLMTNLSKIAVELGDRDDELATLIQGSEGVFRRFAAQNDNLAETLRLLPGALDSSNRALTKAERLGRGLESTLAELEPTAEGLAPVLRQVQPFAEETTPVLRDQLRPFAREAQPTARVLVPAARDLAAATPNLRVLADVLNAIMDEVAYDPPGEGVGEQSTLFYVPWAIHNTNSVLANSDGIGPLRRGLVALSCGQLQLLDSFIKPPRGKTEPRNPTLATLIQLLNAPDREALIASGRCPAPERGR